ncbi:MAG: SIS domain-containing protein [Candidatus Zixiibacteriota bacterium]
MNRQDKLDHLKRLTDETAILRRSLMEYGNQLLDIADLMAGVIGSGHKIMFAGNGGHAAMSSHFATELIVRLTAERNRPSLPAIALSADSGIITAAANDYGYDEVFARQVEGLGQKGDLLVVMSTSGNSANLVKGVRMARQRGVLTCGLLGGRGGKLRGIVDRSILIPNDSPQRIQEEHLFLVHILVEMIESDLFA